MSCRHNEILFDKCPVYVYRFKADNLFTDATESKVGTGIMLKTGLATATASWLWAICVQGHAKEPLDDMRQQVDSLFIDVQGLDEPGCAVGIMRSGRILYSQGFGAADVAHAAANTPTTAFEIASGSKTFTSACIALLMDQGKLRAEDDVRSLIPELQLNKPVRIRHLLRCESGVWAQFHIMPLAGWDNVPVQSPYSKEDFLTVLTGQRTLPFEPGSQFQYSSGDTFLLGIVVERVAGKPLAEFAKDNLFAPLGMTRTWYLEDPGMVVANRARGYWKSDAGWSSGKHSPAGEWRQWHATAYLGGGGSVVTCVEDLFRWSRVYQQKLLPRGKYMDEFTTSGTVLDNRFVLDLDAYRKHVGPHPDNPPAGTYRRAKRIQITGGYWGFSACLSHFPDHDTTIVCLSNSPLSAFSKAREISDIVLADVLAPLPKPTAANSEPEYVKLAADQLSQLAGSYRAKGNRPIWRFTATADGLSLADGVGKPTQLKPLSATRFKPVGESPFYPSTLFEFETQNKPSAAGVKLSSLENGFHEVISLHRVTVAEPYDVAALRQFEGTYISEELGAIYRFRVADRKLQLRVGSRRWESLEALEPDEFSPIVEDPHNTRFIRFSRDENNKVDGFSIGFWRIHGVRFDRLPARRLPP